MHNVEALGISPCLISKPIYDLKIACFSMAFYCDPFVLKIQQAAELWQLTRSCGLLILYNRKGVYGLFNTRMLCLVRAFDGEWEQELGRKIPSCP